MVIISLSLIVDSQSEFRESRDYWFRELTLAETFRDRDQADVLCVRKWLDRDENLKEDALTFRKEFKERRRLYQPGEGSGFTGTLLLLSPDEFISSLIV